MAAPARPSPGVAGPRGCAAAGVPRPGCRTGAGRSARRRRADCRLARRRPSPLSQQTEQRGRCRVQAVLADGLARSRLAQLVFLETVVAPRQLLQHVAYLGIEAAFRRQPPQRRRQNALVRRTQRAGLHDHQGQQHFRVDAVVAAQCSRYSLLSRSAARSRPGRPRGRTPRRRDRRGTVRHSAAGPRWAIATGRVAPPNSGRPAGHRHGRWPCRPRRAPAGRRGTASAGSPGRGIFVLHG